MQKAVSTPSPLQACGPFRPIGQIALNLAALKSLQRLVDRKEAGHE